jgi:phosphate transport system substrate-binding protein
MKLNQGFAVVLVTLAPMVISIALVAIPGCTSKTNSNAANTTQNAPQQLIKIGGSTSTYPIVQLLADAYIAKNQNTQVKFISPSQSEGAIAGVQQGLLDVASISKQFQSQDNDGTLEYREIAHDALVVATHPSVTGITNLSTDNLKAIYSGAVTNWQQLGGPDAKIILLDRPEDESAKRLLRKYYLGEQLQNSPEAVIMRQEPELIQVIESTPYTIGAFSLGYAISHKLPVNRLSLDGIAPTVENVELGKYQMVRSIGMVFKKTSSEATFGYINFANSPEGVQVLRQSGFVPPQKQ